MCVFVSVSLCEHVCLCVCVCVRACMCVKLTNEYYVYILPFTCINVVDMSGLFALLLSFLRRIFSENTILLIFVMGFHHRTCARKGFWGGPRP
jgi:hypothetical protein